jgi:hypothetical protein
LYFFSFNPTGQYTADPLVRQLVHFTESELLNTKTPGMTSNEGLFVDILPEIQKVTASVLLPGNMP